VTYDDRAGERRDAHRPVLVADITALIDAAGGTDHSARAEVAHATARAVISAGRAEASPDRGQSLVGLAEVLGLDTLAALWSDADPVSLPGALWSLYLLREWCQNQPDEVCRLWRLGAAHADVEAVIVGCAADADEQEVQRTADDILDGVYHADPAVALDRASAFYRVIAAGRRERATDAPDWWPDLGSHRPDAQLADRNDAAANHLAVAARHWRMGSLA
jgi:hypothetical protein